MCQNNNYSFRSNDQKLKLPKPKRDFLKQSFAYRGAVALNNLAKKITDGYENLSVSSFKKLIETS